MKRFVWVPVLMVLLGLLGAACGSSPTNPLGSTTGAGGADPTGGGVGPVTSVGSNTSGTNSTGSTTTTGGGCKPGGAGCQAFSECCSGSCADQVCAACGGKGQSCAEGCCQGLTCYNDKCGSCAGDDAPCTLATDCCSNVCTQGTCEHCNGLGESCQGSSKCCSGLACDTDNVCCTKAGGACEASSQCCDGDVCANGVCGAPCGENGLSCTTNAACCSGSCMNGFCGVPCKADGLSCTTNASCCGGVCTNGVCGAACKVDGLSCTTNASCCGGVCTNGICGAPMTTDSLGTACVVNADCGAGLKCLTSTSTVPAFGGGPADGYCSKNCSTDNDCPSPGSTCFLGASPNVGVCVLSCDIGPSLISLDEALDPNKCNGREDVRCGPLDNMGNFYGCLPTCGRDDQCPAGRVCDPRKAVCVSVPSAGLPGGAQCDPMATTTECAGICISFSGGVTSCSSPCVLGGDFTDLTAVTDCGGLDKGVCAYSPAGNGAGDYGYCAAACQTHGDCQNPSFWCSSVGLPSNGYCFGSKACPGGQANCQSPNICTNTQYGPYCLNPQYPLGTAAP